MQGIAYLIFMLCIVIVLLYYYVGLDRQNGTSFDVEEENNPKDKEEQTS